MKKTLVVFLLVALLTIVHSQPQALSLAANADPSLSSYYDSYAGGESPNIFTTVVWLVPPQTPLTPPNDKSYTFTVNSNGGITGAGAVYAATALLHNVVAPYTTSEQIFWVSPITTSGTSATIKVNFVLDTIPAYQTGAISQLGLSVILIDSVFSDGTASHIYARNSLLTDVVATDDFGQFNFADSAGNSPFNYLTPSSTTTCGPVPTGTGSNVNLEVQGCALANFYTFVTGYVYETDTPGTTEALVVRAELVKDPFTTPPDCDAAKAELVYITTTSGSADDSNIFKQDATDTNVGLWIAHCDATDIGTLYKLQVSFVFVGIRSFSPTTYPAGQSVSATDPFNFYAAFAPIDTGDVNFIDAVEPNVYDSGTTVSRWTASRTYDFAHAFCGSDTIATAFSAGFTPQISLSAVSSGFLAAAAMPAATNTDGGPLTQSAATCVFFEKKTPCVEEYTLLGLTSVAYGGSVTSQQVTQTVLETGIGGSATTKFGQSLYNFKIPQIDTNADTAEITLTLTRTVPPTEYIIYAKFTAGAAAAAKQFTVSLDLNGVIVYTAVNDAVTVFEEITYYIHSTDLTQNTFKFIYSDTAATAATNLPVYLEVGVFSADNVLVDTICVMTGQCPERAGFTTGINPLTTPPTCIYCETALNLEYKGDGTCNCIDQYILSTATATLGVCVPCPGTLCAVCPDETGPECTTCVENAVLTTANLCICADGFYKDGTTCKPCPFGCLTCFSATLCGICVASVNADSVITREAPASTCACRSGFYENLVDEVCPPCDMSCVTCSGPSATECLTCDIAGNFLYDPAAKTCKCKIGYYELRTLTDLTCQLCDPKCLTCVTAPTYCVTCPPFREPAGTTQVGVKTCSCVTGFIEIAGQCVDVTCKDVDEFCQTCLYEIVTQTRSCLTCIDNREVVSGFCECKPGFFENANGNCVPCGAGCPLCNSVTDCIDCPLNSIDNFDGTCTCPAGTVLGQSAGTFFCQPCSPSCKTCIDTPSKCLSCAPGFTYNSNTNTCTCPAGTYLAFNGAQCLPCIANCLRCSDATTCDSCDSTRNYAYDADRKRCTLSCPTGTYNAGSTCADCPATCSDCVNPFICVSCKPTFKLFAGSCRSTCPSGTFNSNGECLACLSPCKTCSGTAVKCDSCTNGLLYFNGQCVTQCPASTYYGDGSCLACSPRCLTCTGTSSTCTNCVAGQFLYQGMCYAQCPVAVVGGVCTDRCPDGSYYANNACSQCDPKCEACSGSATNCTACGQGFYSYQGSCIPTCPAGTFINGGSCAACDASCAACSVNQYNCVACAAGYVRFGSSCVLSCGDGFYLGTDKVCRECGAGCKSCFSSSVCSTCVDPSLTPVNGVCQKSCPTGSTLLNGVCTCNFGSLYQGACVSACPEGFYSFNRVCQACSYPCTGCVSSPTNCLSCAAGFNYDVVSKTCIAISPCPYGQYQNAVGTCVNICAFGLFYKGACIYSCPSGYVDNNYGGCIENVSPTFCPAPLFRQGNVCVSTCQTGFWPNSLTRVCDPCGSRCQSCLNANYCLACAAGFVLDANRNCIAAVNCSANQVQYNGRCWNGCPTGTYIWGNTCLRACPANTYFLNNFCYPTCPTGYALRTADACVTVCPSGSTAVGSVCTWA